MKQLITMLLCVLLCATTASAQQLQIGIRGGVNLSDYKFNPTTIGGIHFSPGTSRAGYEVGFVVRFNILKQFHLQTELNYAFARYEARVSGGVNSTIKLRSDRLEIPLQAGLQFGVVRLFAGALIRLTESGHSSAPKWLKVGFNNDDIGLIGGVGLNIRKFFVDLRISGYPRSRVWHTFTSDTASKRIVVAHDIFYGGSLGFFF